MPLFPARSRVLVPLELPDPEEIPRKMIDLLGGVDVLLVGWVEVPDQTPPEQAKEQMDDTGEETLESVAEKLRDAGAEVETRHVFTPDLVATIQRIGSEELCEGALISGPVHDVERILVVLREDVAPSTVGTFLSDLSEIGSQTVTLLQISEGEADEGRDWSERVLDDLSDRGIDTDRVETRVETSEDPGERVLEICRDEEYDVVIIPERGEMEDRLFGSFAEKVGREAELPVLVLRVGDESRDGGEGR